MGSHRIPGPVAARPRAPISYEERGRIRRWWRWPLALTLLVVPWAFLWATRGVPLWSAWGWVGGALAFCFLWWFLYDVTCTALGVLFAPRLHVGPQDVVIHHGPFARRRIASEDIVGAEATSDYADLDLAGWGIAGGPAVRVRLAGGGSFLIGTRHQGELLDALATVGVRSRDRVASADSATTTPVG